MRRRLWVVVVCVAACQQAEGAARLTLKNGMVFEGNFSSIAKLSENPLARTPSPGGVDLRPVVVVDDELRRTYFPKRQLAFPPVEANVDERPIRIRQRVSSSRARVGVVGAILEATPFDAWGRRTVTVKSPEGPREVIQGITEISPVYCRVQGLQGEGGVTWDMRVATSSIPLDTLRSILAQNSRGSGAEAQRDLVRLLFQAERYMEAARELEKGMERFPELQDLKDLNEQLIQQSAQRLLREIERRKKAGQHRYVSFLLRGFPSQNVATENLIQASDMLKEYDRLIDMRKRVLDTLKPLVETVQDAARRKLVDQVYVEIERDLNVNNMNRMTDVLRFASTGNMAEDALLSIAISDWLLGQGSGNQNLAVAASLIDVRNLVREYLNAMGAENTHTRQELLGRIKDREGGTPTYVAKILEHMTPPFELPEATDIPGYFVVDVPGTPQEFPVRYHVQLPPEYDPYVRYPMIVTLPSPGFDPRAQVEWWTGAHRPVPEGKPIPQHMGAASRDGFIVVAPEWSKGGQRRYEYSAGEHYRVLTALRDAMRRFAVDSDRVFLSGHAVGGDAAWDIGLAHPDLWAGMVLIGARSDYGRTAPQYVTLYSNDNGRLLPMYFVYGELDGNKMGDSSTALNRYMGRAGFDPVVVRFRGRGNEHFFEETQRIHQWMLGLKRDFFPEKFEVDSLRPWDAYFWYVEIDDLPPASMVSPVSWPAKRAVPCRTRGAFVNNHVNIRTGATNTTVWLSPDVVDFSAPIEVKVNGRQYRGDITQDLETMLEDARQRADRQHVFWAKVEFGPGMSRSSR